MLKDFARLAAGVAAVPASAAATAAHRWATGPRAILELQIRTWDEVGVRYQVLKRLRRLAYDPTVAGVFLRIDAAPGSWAACQDLRAVLERIRAAGKAVYAFLETPGNAAIWVAAGVDRVFLVPTAEVGLVGVGVELTFLGEALKRLGIEPDFEAAGAYKSFGEPYTRTHASPENQEAVRVLVEDMQEQLVEGIASGRGLSAEEVHDLLARAPIPAADAVEAGLVDQAAYEDEAREWIEEHHGSKTHFVKFGAWARRDLVLEWVEHWGDDDKQIAILHLQGPIVVDDKTPAHTIRARQVVPLLRHLRDNEDIEAVVLHINSPGGSALASDIIWREVDLLRREKPVVASFEDVAASGGYYLAAPAVEIIARPGTLTGSIGVFGGKLVMGRAMRQLGVHTQGISSSPNANLFSASRPFTDDQRTRFRSSLQRFYDGFIDRVASGRRQPADVIEPHCRGRVWTGRLALRHGLVDRSGDLFEAVERARVLAGLHVGGYREVNVAPSPRQNLMARVLSFLLREIRPRLGDGAVERVAALMRVTLGSTLTPMLDVVLAHPGEALAMLPFDLRPR
ncbi:MAG: S49 family peptidase [Deltaproteobacteria bacterium]|nr:S49 family peptidase [Deltaproteobacteria bacterium]